MKKGLIQYVPQSHKCFPSRHALCIKMGQQDGLVDKGICYRSLATRFGYPSATYVDVEGERELSL